MKLALNASRSRKFSAVVIFNIYFFLFLYYKNTTFFDIRVNPFMTEADII